MSSTQRNLSWLAQVVAAGVLIMAAPGKFTGAATPIFEALGAEPSGRWLTGLLEVAAVVLLLVPKPYLGRHAIGALVAAAVMLGALGAHATTLGFDGEMASLAGMATVGLVASLVVLWVRRAELPV